MAVRSAGFEVRVGSGYGWSGMVWYEESNGRRRKV